MGSAWADRACFDSEHVAISGTSMATPHVAGVLALLRQAHPELGPGQVKDLLKATAVSLGVGLDANTQGSGLVDAQSALLTSGLPNSVARIGNLPLVFIDTPATAVQEFSKTVTVTNTSTQPLTYTPSFTTSQAGLTVSFIPASLVLAPGTTANLTVKPRVDHNVVPGPIAAHGMVTFSTSAGQAQAGLVVQVQNRLVANPVILDLGVDYPDQSIWSTQAQVALTNTMTDLGGTYSVTLTCCDSAGASTLSAITASASASTVSVSPGGTANLNINLTANNTQLSSNWYSGTLKLVSPLQALTIPIKFFKGYVLRLNHGPTTPTQIYVFDDAYRTAVVKPSGATTTIYTDGRGPWHLEGLWWGAAPVLAHHVIETGILLDQPIVEMTLEQSAATHTVVVAPVDPSGVSRSAQGLYAFRNRSNGLGFQVSTGLSASDQIMVSDLPPAYNFEAAALMQAGDSLANVLFEHRTGIASDLTLTNSPSSYRPFSVASFQNRVPEKAFSVFAGIGLSSYSPDGAGPDSPWYANWLHTPIGTDSVVTVQVATHDPLDPALRSRPDYPFAMVGVGFWDGGLHLLDEGPSFYPMPTGLRRWRGDTLTSWTDVVSPRVDANAHFTEHFRRRSVDVPPGNVLTLGNGPVFDSSRWFNLANVQVKLSGYRGKFDSYHLWGSSGDEMGMFGSPFSEMLTSYTLSRDGTQVASGQITPYMDLSAPKGSDGFHTPTGSYRFEMSRNASINHVVTQVRTVSTFRVVDEATHAASPVDENPPAITDMHLLGLGIWQNVIDPSVVHQLEFRVDPVPGFLAYDNSIGAVTRMSDALALPALAISQNDGASWSNLPLTSLGDGRFRASIPTSASVSLYTFRLNARDSAANTLEYTFQIPAGTALQPPSSGSDTQAPTVSMTAPANGSTVSGTAVVVSASASDNVGVARVEFYRDAWGAAGNGHHRALQHLLELDDGDERHPQAVREGASMPRGTSDTPRRSASPSATTPSSRRYR